jgi:hypothetical protein
MELNSLTFSRSGRGEKLYRVSPLLFGQDKLNNKYFLPGHRDLPWDALHLKFLTFDFGFATPGSVIAPYNMSPMDLVVGPNFLACSITGASVPQPSATPPTVGQPGAQQSPAFLVTFLHTHEGVQRQWANKDLYDGQAVGIGMKPTVFKSPVLILAGDTLECQVRNLSNCNLQVQIMLAGGEF